MTTVIAVSPLGRQLEASGEVIQLQVYVTDLEFAGLYDQLEVWRSRDADAGPYEELTSAAVRGARVPKDAPDAPASPVTGPSVSVVGLELELLLNEQNSRTVLFTGADPLTYAEIASQIEAQAPDVNSYVVDTPQVVLQTMEVGTAASLRVVGGNAAPLLGLPTEEPASLAFGKDARVSLTPGTNVYTFADLFGSANYSYKIRFRNSSTGAVSEFSLPHNVASKIGVPPSDLILGQVDLVQVGGKPLINQPVRIHVEYSGAFIGDKVVAGSDLEKLTDANGHVEFLLVRGQKVAVALPGTSLVRVITTPSDPARETFNLLDPDIADQDIFRVQVPELFYAPRRSL